MQCCIVHYSTVYSTVKYSAVQHCDVQSSTSLYCTVGGWGGLRPGMLWRGPGRRHTTLKSPVFLYTLLSLFLYTLLSLFLYTLLSLFLYTLLSVFLYTLISVFLYTLQCSAHCSVQYTILHCRLHSITFHTTLHCTASPQHGIS